jgi:hypothetical protein
MTKMWIAPAIEEQTEIVAQLSTNAGPGSAGGGNGGNDGCCPC